MKLFEILQRELPPNYSRVTMQQAKEADRMLWKKLADSTRGNVSQRPDGTKPIEAALTMLAIDPGVHFLMMPIQKSSRPSPYDKDPKDKPGEGKGKKGKEGKGSSGPPD